MPVCMWASTTPGNASQPLASYTVFASPAERFGPICENFSALIAMSASSTELAFGRTTRTFLMRRSQRLPSLMRFAPGSKRFQLASEHFGHVVPYLLVDQLAVAHGKSVDEAYAGVGRTVEELAV